LRWSLFRGNSLSLILTRKGQILIQLFGMKTLLGKYKYTVNGKANLARLESNQTVEHY